MSPIDHLTQLFSKYPGIGSRQARRFVYFLLKSDKSFFEELVSVISSIKKTTDQCKVCCRFFENRREKEKICEICNDPNIDRSVLMIVEKDIDLENMRKSKIFNGRYFVLGGVQRSRELLREVGQQTQKGGLKEVIIAMNANPEGDSTAIHLEKLLKPSAEKHSLKIVTLGRGLSTGTELEYSDSETIKNALENRR